MTPRHDPGHHRWRDAAAVLPLAGTLLLMPPFLNLFTREAMLFGLPLEVVYLFAIWAALVGGAVIVSRRLGRGPGAADPGADPGADP